MADHGTDHGHDVEEAQLAHDEILAEHEADPFVEFQAELKHLLARLQMLPHLVRFKVLTPAADHGAGLGRIALLTGDLDAADEHHEQALQLVPGHALATADAERPAPVGPGVPHGRARPGLGFPAFPGNRGARNRVVAPARRLRRPRAALAARGPPAPPA